MVPKRYRLDTFDDDFKESLLRPISAKSFFEGSPKPFAHFYIGHLHESTILLKMMNLLIYTGSSFFNESPMRFNHFIFLHKMMIHKIMILSYLSKVIFLGKS